MSELPRSGRARAMPPDERRAAIIAAALPLLQEHGTATTTRQIADAAGIAEGTIFRVFPDKDSLVQAAVDHVLDPEPVKAALLSIDDGLPLETRLVAAVEILQHRINTIVMLMSSVGMLRPGLDKSRFKRNDDVSALAAVFEPDRHRLAVEPLAAAQLLRGLTFGGCHPMFIVDEPMSSVDIVRYLLNGISAEPSHPAAEPTPLAIPQESPC